MSLFNGFVAVHVKGMESHFVSTDRQAYGITIDKFKGEASLI